MSNKETGYAQFKLRMPTDLRDWVAAKAAQNHRSIGKEIIHRLEQSRAQEPMKEAA